MRFFQFLKKFGLLCLALSFPLIASARIFADVSAFYKHYQAISHLSDLGVIDGYPDGSFQPERTINRAEAVKLLIASIKPDYFIQEATRDFYENNISSSFYDVYLNEWFGPHVTLAHQYGIVEGYPDGSFRPGNSINFAEGLKVIIEAYGVDVQRVRFNYHPLLYVQNGDWFARYFNYAYNKNLINRDKFYHPAQQMTRGEFAEILYRLRTVKEEGLVKFQSDSQPYSNEYMITIPRLDIVNVNVSFADTYDSENALAVLKNGMGHYLSPPGSGHKMVLFGHSSGYSWDNSSYKHLLRQINRLGLGDLIYINYQEKGYIYQVSNKEILPANKLDVVLKDYNYEEIAMYTCWPPDSISQRYVVYAGRI